MNYSIGLSRQQASLQQQLQQLSIMSIDTLTVAHMRVYRRSWRRLDLRMLVELQAAVASGRDLLVQLEAACEAHVDTTHENRYRKLRRKLRQHQQQREALVHRARTSRRIGRRLAKEAFGDTTETGISCLAAVSSRQVTPGMRAMLETYALRSGRHCWLLQVDRGIYASLQALACADSNWSVSEPGECGDPVILDGVLELWEADPDYPLYDLPAVLEAARALTAGHAHPCP